MCGCGRSGIVLFVSDATHVPNAFRTRQSQLYGGKRSMYHTPYNSVLDVIYGISHFTTGPKRQCRSESASTLNVLEKSMIPYVLTPILIVVVQRSG